MTQALQARWAWLEDELLAAAGQQPDGRAAMTKAAGKDPEPDGCLHAAVDLEQDLAEFGDDELIMGALSSASAGIDLCEMTRRLEAGLRHEEAAVVEEYVRESAGVAELRLGLEQCNAELSEFEDMLHKCQSDLGNIAGGVRHMKERADAFDVLLHNRQAAETAVASWVEGLTLPPGLAMAIHQLDLADPAYGQHLSVLQDKLALLAKHTDASGQMPVSLKGSSALLKRLRARALDRISTHLKAQMRLLEDDNELLYVLTLGQAGKGDANQLLYTLTLGQAGAKGAVQQLRARQRHLLQFAPLILFLMNNEVLRAPAGHGPDEMHRATSVYTDVLAHYTTTMRSALASQIRAEYRVCAVAGVRHVISSKHVLLDLQAGGDKSAVAALMERGAAVAGRGISRGLAGVTRVKRGLSRVVGAAARDSSHTCHLHPISWAEQAEPCESDWALGTRLRALLQVHLSHAASLQAVADSPAPDAAATPHAELRPELVLERVLAACKALLDNESLVVCRLFPRRSGHELIDMFGAALAVMRQATHDLIFSCTDPISLLLMAVALERSHRCVCDVLCCDPGAGGDFDAYYTWGYMAVWERFKHVVDGLLAAMRAAAVSLDVSSAQGEIDAFVERYAQLSAALNVIVAHLQTQTAQLGRRSLQYMWGEVSRVLRSWALHLGGGKSGSIFVINQVSRIRSVYYDQGVCAAACAPLRQLLDEYLEHFLPLVLGQRFEAMRAVMARLESSAPDSGSPHLWAAADLAEANDVVVAFRQHWKMDAATTAAAVKASLVHADDARQVAKRGLVKLLLVYTRLCDAVRRAVGESASLHDAVLQQMVPEESIVAEIERLTGLETLASAEAASV